MKPSYISSEEVESVLTWSLVNNGVEAALKAVSSKRKGACNQPARSFTLVEDNKGVLLNMPAYLGSYDLSENETNLSTLGCKLVTSFSGNSRLEKPMPSILANILLFDSITGQLKTILDGTEITSWRTASASVIATKYLYFHRSGIEINKSIKLAVFGCGVQGRYHSLAFCSTFNVEEIHLWNRSKGKAQILADELDKFRNSFVNKNVKIIVSEEKVTDADVIVTATYTKEPIINLDSIKKNVHINAVGAGETHHGELSQDLYDIAKVYVDHMAGAEVELKTLKAEIVGEVGEVIINKKYPSDGITIFQSMGMAAEDAVVAQAVVNALQKLN
ncbi:CRYM family protein [Megaselia abdita]